MHAVVVLGRRRPDVWTGKLLREPLPRAPLGPEADQARCINAADEGTGAVRVAATSALVHPQALAAIAAAVLDRARERGGSALLSTPPAQRPCALEVLGEKHKPAARNGQAAEDVILRLKIAPQQSDALAWLHENGEIMDERSDPETGATYAVARLSGPDAGRFRSRFPGLEIAEEKAAAE